MRKCGIQISFLITDRCKLNKHHYLAKNFRNKYLRQVFNLYLGVMLTHQNLTSGLCIANDINSGCVHRPLPTGIEQYIALSIIPMFHIYGLVYNVMQPLTLGVKMVSLPKFDAGHFIATMEAQV